MPNTIKLVAAIKEVENVCPDIIPRILEDLKDSVPPKGERFLQVVRTYLGIGL